MFKSIQINGISYTQEFAVQQQETSSDSFLKEVLHFFIEFTQNEVITLKTSGSTGTPKILEFSREQLLASAQITANTFQLKPKSNLLLCLPMQFVAAKLMVVRAIYLQANLVVLEPKSNIWNQLNEPIDFAAFVPMQIEACINQSYQHKLEAIPTVIIGGAPLNNELLQQLKPFKNALYQTYGMTETLTHVAVKLISQNTQNQHYTALHSISFSQNNTGCLVIQAPHIQKEAIETTDLVELHSPTEFTWLGRADGIINSGGVKLIPEVIEEKLRPFIPYRFFVGPKRSQKLGEMLVAYVVVHPKDFTPNLNDIKKALHKYEVPKEFIYCKAFHETESGKIQRQLTQNDPSLFF